MAALIAIDPGAISGAVAVFRNGNGPTVADLDVVNKQVDPAAFARLLGQWAPAIAVVENVGAMPGQGVASTFRFGMACGVIQGVLAACRVPVHLVSPPTWKRPLGLLGKDKEAARALAIRFYPSVRGLERKRDQGRAEALLIGHWYRHFYGRPGKLWQPGNGDRNGHE